MAREAAQDRKRIALTHKPNSVHCSTRLVHNLLIPCRHKHARPSCHIDHLPDGVRDARIPHIIQNQQHSLPSEMRSNALHHFFILDLVPDSTIRQDLLPNGYHTRLLYIPIKQTINM